MNAANLRPPFTPETARAAAKASWVLRKARQEREKAELEELARLKAQLPIPDNDEARKRRVQKQIDLLLTDMEKAKTIDARLTIAAAVERLWKLVQPVAGRAPKSRRSSAPLAEPLP